VRRRTPTYTAVDDQLVSSGIQLDRHSLKRLLWESAANVTFWNGTVRRKIPAAHAFGPWNGVLRISGLGQQFMQDGERRVWAQQGLVTAAWNGVGSPATYFPLGTYVDDATATQRPTMVDFTPYGDWMIVNDEGNKPAIIKDTVSTYYADGELPDSGIVKFIKMLSFMIALGTGPRRTGVKWSDANDIEVYTATNTNTAGELSIDEFNTPIRGGAKLGDALAVYSEDQLALVRYVGAPFIFGQKTTIDGIGAIGKAAVASDTRINVGLGRAGAWWTDGNSSRYIDEGFLANYLQDEVNWDQAAKSVVCRNDFTGCFEFHMPMHSSLDVNEAWSWDPRTGGWSPCPPYAMMDERRLFEHVLYGDGAGNVLFGDFDPSAAAPLVLETKPLVMQTEESPHVVSRVDEIDLLLHKATGIEFRIGCSDEPNGTWEWSEWQPAEAGARIYQVPASDDSGAPLPEQPYWKVGFRSAAGLNNWDLDLQGFLLYGVPVGTKM